MTSPGERTDLACGECGAKMKLRPSKYGLFYGCTRYPACGGTHGAHPDGSPKGRPSDKATREARIAAHAAFDRLWKEGFMHRAAAYSWMQRVMGLSSEDAHIGQFGAEQCRALVGHVEAFFAAWAADDTAPLRSELRRRLVSVFGNSKTARRRARGWLAGALALPPPVFVHSLSGEQCRQALACPELEVTP